MFCKNCGRRIEEGRRFCAACGTAVTGKSLIAESAGKKIGIKIAIIAAACIVVVEAALAGVFLYSRQEREDNGSKDSLLEVYPDEEKEDGGAVRGENENVAETTETVEPTQEEALETTETVELTPEEPADTSWAKIYYDYLTTDPEGISIMGTYGGKYWGGDNYVWNLIYTDDDKVPELYMQSEIYASGDVLLYISGGKVKYEYFSSGGGSYIPYSGWMKDDNTHMGYNWGTLYRWEGGVRKEMGGYGGMMSADGYGMEDAEYRVGGKEVSQEQYEEFVRTNTGGMEFQSCMNFENPIYESCLDFLNGIIQRG